MDFLTEGLMNYLDQMQVQNDRQSYIERILKVEDKTTYKVRFLKEQQFFPIMEEHSFVPTMFTKQNGEQKPGNNTFQCTYKSHKSCPICNKQYLDEKTGKMITSKPRKLMIIPVYIKETVDTSKGNAKPNKVNESKVLILPAGKDNSIWLQLVNSFKLRGTLMDRDYIIERRGTGLNTVWSITGLDKEDFDYNSIPEDEQIDAKDIVAKSGRWKNPLDLQSGLSFRFNTDILEEPSSENDRVKQMIDMI